MRNRFGISRSASLVKGYLTKVKVESRHHAELELCQKKTASSGVASLTSVDLRHLPNEFPVEVTHIHNLEGSTCTRTGPFAVAHALRTERMNCLSAAQAKPSTWSGVALLVTSEQSSPTHHLPYKLARNFFIRLPGKLFALYCSLFDNSD